MAEVFPAPLRASFPCTFGPSTFRRVHYTDSTRSAIGRLVYIIFTIILLYIPTRHIKSPIVVVLVNSESDSFTEPLVMRLRQQTKTVPAICERLIKIGEGTAEHS